MLTGLATRTISRCCPKIEIQNFNIVKCKSTSFLSFPHSSHLYGHPFHSSHWTSPITPPPFKDKEVAQARRASAIVVFQKFIKYMKKHHRKSRQTKIWGRANAIRNLQPCYNFALALQLFTLVTWECTRFQPIRSA